MTETEKRRIELLQQTRRTYSEKYTPPAVHPRYQAVYRSLYKNEAEEKTTSSFMARLVIALLLFGAFFLANQKGLEETEIVANEIQQEFHGFVDLQIFR